MCNIHMSSSASCNKVEEVAFIILHCIYPVEESFNRFKIDTVIYIHIYIHVYIFHCIYGKIF